MAASNTARFAAVAILGVTISGCSMLDSSLLEPGNERSAAGGQPICTSHTGAYYLSKAFFRVKVDRNPAAAGIPERLTFAGLEINYRPDRTKGYCLEYAASPTAHDKVKVFKVKASRQVKVKEGEPSKTVVDPRSDLAASGSDLLHAITTDAIDESAFILKTLIRTLFIGISGNPGFNTTGTVQGRSLNAVVPPDSDTQPIRILDAEYDPFNLAQSALVNDSLSRLGFCVLLQGVSVPLLRSNGHHHHHHSIKDHGYTPETINSYCDDPQRITMRNFEYAQALLKAEEAPAVRQTRGIFYRPRIPFTVHLFLKPNRKVPGGWELRGSEVVELENISPVVSVGINRAFFAQRKTTVVFDRGVVKNVCIFKTSELAAFVEVPLEIAKSVVALPANIIQVKIDSTANDQRLLKAQNTLLKTEISRLKLEKSATDASTSYTPTADLAAQATKAQAVNQQNQNINSQAAVASLLEEQLALQLADNKSSYYELNADFSAACPEPTAKTAGSTPIQ